MICVLKFSVVIISSSSSINSKMANKQVDKEVHISLEDQQKINKFARLNSRLEDLKEELKAKKGEIETLEDASTDLMMFEDDDEKVPYQVGEVFVYLTQDEAQQKIESSKESLGESVKTVENKAQSVKDEMAGLKAQLYAKFGSAINLEADEE